MSKHKDIIVKPSSSLAGRTQALLHISLLCLLLPLTLAFTLWKFIIHCKQRKIHENRYKKKEPARTVSNDSNNERLTVLVTGGKMAKSLVVTRCLWRMGHRVVLVETSKYWCSGTRFSRAVWKFETVSEEDVNNGESYVQEMVQLIKKYRVDVFIPVQSPKVVHLDAEIKRIVESDSNLHCRCPFFDTQMVSMLDDKHSFGRHCRDHGLPAPETWKVESDQDVMQLNKKLLLDKSKGKIDINNKKYILKNLKYDPIHRLDMFSLPQTDETLVRDYLTRVACDGNAITVEEPWQVQEFISGIEYCACCVVRNNKLLALSICKSSPSQLNYIECQRLEVIRPIEDFFIKLVSDTFPANTDGMFCLDIIVSENQKSIVPYAIECNPRIHSQMTVYFQNNATIAALGHALVSSGTSTRDNQKMTTRSIVNDQEELYSFYWLYNEVFKLIFPQSYGTTSLERLWKLVSNAQSCEADLDPKSPWSFIMRNHFQIPILLVGIAWRGGQWKKCDFNIGKVVEVGGD